MRCFQEPCAGSYRERLFTIIAFGILPLAVLSGCVVTVDPVISESDATMDSRLLGSWEEVSGSGRAVVSRAAETTYAIEYTRDNKTGWFEARLGKLGDRSIVDVRPVLSDSDQKRPGHFLLSARHLLLDLDIGPDEVRVSSLNEKAMRDALDAGDVDLAYTKSGDNLVLHGTTKELRAALSAHLGSSGPLGTTEVWRRREGGEVSQAHGPSVFGIYNLIQINEENLPAVAFTGPKKPNGDQCREEMLSMAVILEPKGRSSEFVTGRDVCVHEDGSETATEEEMATWIGSYTISGDQLTIQGSQAVLKEDLLIVTYVGVGEHEGQSIKAVFQRN